MKESTGKRVGIVIGVVILTILIYIFFSNLLIRRYSTNQYRLFYDKSKEYDVLFFGASVVHDGILPMELWNDYGITSYNMGNDSERLKMTYYDLVNALDYANPKLVVFDLCAIGWAGAERDGTLKDHAFLDAVPLSVNKLKEINDIFEGKERFEYIFPFILYHSRWNELSAEDFYFHGTDARYGAEIITGILPTQAPDPNRYEESRDTDISQEYDTIQKVIDICEERGIKLVFTYMPNGHRGGDLLIRDKCDAYMESIGADYHNFLYLDFLDWDRDFKDGAHLNYFGAKKYTDFYGKMLSTEYGMIDHRQDDFADSWNNDYEEYKNMLSEILTDEVREEYKSAAKR